MNNIAIFASGDGSNAENIVRYFADNKSVRVKCVLSNVDNAGVHLRMKRLGVPSITFSNQLWREASGIAEYLRGQEIDLIVLAGFLCILQPPIISSFAGKIINIHPSLLPKFGGKGMWGMNVHRAVIEAKESESGITIHYVNAEIDGGTVILQARCPIYENDTAETLAQKVHELEYEHYPRVIESLLNG